jgi:hypothetical protein
MVFERAKDRWDGATPEEVGETGHLMKLWYGHT